MIADLEKKLADDPEFPCCSCERIHQRKQVTAFKFHEAKFSSNRWKHLKAKRNPAARTQTHYVCQYCRPKLNADQMPCRCVLNGLVVEPVPNELKSLDPLNKQLIQRAKAFQAVFRLGTYTGRVPSHHSLKACKGRMFFLPLPLDKTSQTLEEIAQGSLAKLPDPQLYIIVNSKSKSKKMLWQSFINIRAAVMKLREINWLYANVDENSLDAVSDTTSKKLAQVSTDDVSEYQSYTIRRLDQRQSNKPDTDQYKLMDVQEDAISNKLKHLDMLCFPTLFPTGRFGESHPRDNAISVSEFAKSHLLNKDSRFRKDDQYVFYLLWQKEMRDISAGVYNLLDSMQCPLGSLWIECPHLMWKLKVI